MSTTAWGVGIATLDANGATLDVRFRAVGLGDAVPTDAPSVDPSVDTDGDRGVVLKPVSLVVDTASGPTDSADAYLRLNLLSQRVMKPRSMNLDGIFGHLQNVAWTDRGPVAVDTIESVTWNLARKGQHLVVHGVDKFPRMTDYVIPSGVRIADASRVRLGAYLSSGTTVMHEGFCNFNAGTLGTSMVEGRISQGVLVGDGSDIGGGASIMGTLSGGGKDVISIGERSLLGANAGVGISLGDDCIVESGVYITAGSKIALPDGSIVKARELSGANNLIFRRNSQSGSLEALPKTGQWDGLNSILHAN